MNKIKLIKKNGEPVPPSEKRYEVKNSLENQYNAILAESEQLNITVITPNVYEWFIRTLAAEVYKLSFIDENKFYRIKMLWPSFQQKDILFFLQQFDGFDMEDYFDILIIPGSDHKKPTFRVLENGFTMGKNNEKHTEYPCLYYFTEHSEQFDNLQDILNYFIRSSKKQAEDLNKAGKIQSFITEEQLNERLKLVAGGQTRLMLNELYNQDK